MTTVFQITRDDSELTQLGGDFSTHGEAFEAVLENIAVCFGDPMDQVLQQFTVKPGPGPMDTTVSYGDDLSHIIHECEQGTFMDLPQWLDPADYSPEVYALMMGGRPTKH